ncbi:hypothetical protein M885DRAFT_626931 [Pelagophyceae sp. CCMP2097]|nr:hypothetical protein M885DRAFT_626931 [Pelagophyceae sp. CCMP2097]
MMLRLLVASLAASAHFAASARGLRFGSYEKSGAEISGGVCFSSAPATPIEGCVCHHTCASCGYYDNPIDNDDCIACADGSEVTQVYTDGTGTCGV